MNQMKLSNGTLIVRNNAVPRKEVPWINQPYLYAMSRPRSPLVDCGLDLWKAGGMLIDDDRSRWMDILKNYGSGSKGIKGAALQLSMWGYFRRSVVHHAKDAALEIAIDVIRRIGGNEIYFECDDGVKILALLPN